MKKNITKILVIMLIVLAIIIGKYMNYKIKLNELKKSNLEYESYYQKEIYGTEIATVVNKAINQNEKNEVPKDENGKYIQNNVNSIKVEVHITDNETLYDMETLYSGTMTTFVQYYNSIKFKCTTLTYNDEGRVNYMYFEQISE